MPEEGEEEKKARNKIIRFLSSLTDLEGDVLAKILEEAAERVLERKRERGL